MVVIKVQNLSKKYVLGAVHTNLLSERLGNNLRSFYRRLLRRDNSRFTIHHSPSSDSPFTIHHSPEKDFWALKDVSFEVKQGEVIGIIGRNGAGKSTLLKILSKITSPTSGRVEMVGRVASLLEVGTGFHPELTGRENIFLNGAILGMTKAEIKRKFDEIVAFAEVEKFIDTPVKRYSSGMYVRLAFAVAAHLEPEILIVDEVLAVGDAQFQKKCLGKMGDVAKEGRTVLFVSHNMTAIQILCTKVMEIKHGQMATIGSPQVVISNYLGSEDKGTDNASFSPMELSNNLVLSVFNFVPAKMETGQVVIFEIKFEGRNHCRIDSLVILFYSSLGERIAIIDLRSEQFPIYCDTEPIVLRGRIVGVPFVEGDYKVGLYVDSNEARKDFFDLCILRVMSRHSENGIIPYPVQLRGLIELNFEPLSVVKAARKE